MPRSRLADALHLLLPALGVAIVAYSDNMLTAQGLRGRHAETIDSNQELLALGAANIAAGLLQGFPISSSGSRTAIGDALGSRTQLYSLVALVVGIAGTVFFLRPVLAAFPTAALGAVVVYAAIRLIDVAELRRIARFRRSELLLAVATTVAVLVLGVLYGVLVAAVAVRRWTCCAGWPVRTTACSATCPASPACTTSTTTRRPPVPGLVVYRYDSPLFFANAEDFRTPRAGRRRQASGTAAQWFVLNAEANVERRHHRRRRAGGAARASCRTAASSSPWPGSSRTCAGTCRPPASSTSSAATGSS